MLRYTTLHNKFQFNIIKNITNIIATTTTRVVICDSRTKPIFSNSLKYLPKMHPVVYVHVTCNLKLQI